MRSSKLFTLFFMITLFIFCICYNYQMQQYHSLQQLSYVQQQQLEREIQDKQQLQKNVMELNESMINLRSKLKQIENGNITRHFFRSIYLAPSHEQEEKRNKAERIIWDQLYE